MTGALHHTDALQIAETPDATFVGLVRDGRGKVRVGTMTTSEKQEIRCAPQAVEAATRSGIHRTTVMRMRWVVADKPVHKPKRRPQRHAQYRGWKSAFLDDDKITQNAGVQG